MRFLRDDSFVRYIEIFIVSNFSTSQIDYIYNIFYYVCITYINIINIKYKINIIKGV